MLENNSNVLGPVIGDIAGTSLSEEDIALIKNPLVGGLILFTRNYASPQQLTALVQSIRGVRSNIIIAVDHEGGRVQRFREGFTRIPAMQVFTQRYRANPAATLEFACNTGWLMASELRAFDIDISFAPVLDVDDHFSSIIGDRAFSSDPEEVTALAGAFIDGMHQAGMATTGKHFPGHGSVKADSHLELPVDDRSMQAIEQLDLVPFHALKNKLDALMPAHIFFPQVDGQAVGFSRVWLKNILREQMGYDGVIFSDDLSMEGAAVAGGFSDRALKAMAAGCDTLLVCNNRAATLEVIGALEQDGRFCTSTRLSRMQGGQRPSSLAALQLNARWVDTHRMLLEVIGQE